MIAVSESTPGPIAINMATYRGFQMGGVAGSVVATIGVALPSVVISLLICRLFSRYAASTWPERAFYGLRPAVAGLISVVAWQLISLSLFAQAELGLSGSVSWPAVILFLLLLPFVFRLKLHPLVFIGVGAVVGMVFKL
jgi:chromate transporter